MQMSVLAPTHNTLSFMQMDVLAHTYNPQELHANVSAGSHRQYTELLPYGYAEPHLQYAELHANDCAGSKQIYNRRLRQSNHYNLSNLFQ